TDQTVDALTPVQFTAAAVDGDPLTFSLVGAPAGAAIDPVTGAFTWTPTIAQGATSYPFVVHVTDPGGLFADRPITITVRPLVNATSEQVTVTDSVVVTPIGIVPLTSPDPNASETGPDVGVFRFSRTGGTSLDLVVGFTIGGTATNGVDYQTIAS